MDVLSPFLHLVLRSLVVLFPLTVGWLAFRRLAISKSANAWVYAVICLFAAVTAAGVLPWTLGLTPIKWPLVLLALICPVIWIVTIFICDVSRIHRYDPDPLIATARAIAKKVAITSGQSPLVLKPSDAPAPMFRHRAKPTPPLKRASERSATTQNILNLARDIRGNRSSDRRRPKLLPPPEKAELPFLSRSRDA